MADDDLDDDTEDMDDGELEGGGGRSKLPLIIGAVVLLLLIGGGAAAYFTGMLDSLLGGSEDQMAEGEGGEGASAALQGTQGVFFDLEEILVNLNTQNRKSVFLKIRVALEVPTQADQQQVEAVMPRVIDNFQTYLRELRVEDLEGSAGMYRLREELLTRVNAAVKPAKVTDVLFKEMLVQ